MKILISTVTAVSLFLTGCASNHSDVKKGYLAESYKDINPLMTDFYQITMASVYFESGRKDEEATFYMHWRTPPFGGGYTLAAGLEGVIDFLENFHFKPEDIEYLRQIKDANGHPMFKEDFLQYLSEMKLDLNIDAVPEGTVMIGKGPVIRVSGPLIQCQLVETAILTIMNSSSIVATRAARISSYVSKHGASCADFSLRRSPTLDLTVARSAYIGGFNATATVNAGKVLGIPVVGTMAHSLITSFQDPSLSNSDVERAAFKEFLSRMKGNGVLLVDTFDTKRGIVNALEIAEELSIPLLGIRLDSGDLYELSWYAHEQIQKAKARRQDLFSKTQIFLTDGLDEEKIVGFFERSQAEKGVAFPARRFGVGTKLGNPGPMNGGVYKLSGFRKDPKGAMIATMKLGENKDISKHIFGEKTSLPGEGLDTLRLFDKEGKIVGEVIVDKSTNIPELLRERKAIRVNGKTEGIETLPEFSSSKLLLEPVFKRSEIPGQKAERIYSKNLLSLSKLQNDAKQQVESIPEGLKALKPTSSIPYFVSPTIYANAKTIIAKNQKTS
jgi:nicotinate phosphoribosyltransferase